MNKNLMVYKYIWEKVRIYIYVCVNRQTQIKSDMFIK